MKNDIWTVAKKEFARFFGDKRMVVSTLLLPGAMIYVLYSFMGTAMNDAFSVDDEYAATVQMVNMPDSVETMISSGEIKMDVEEIDEGGIEAAKEMIEDQQLDLCVVCPENFDSEIASYGSALGGAAPNVDIYYNSASTESSEGYMTMTGILDGLEAMLANKFDINNSDQDYDMATNEDTTGMIFSSMLPMLLMVFLYSGCIAVAPESIAGEKERGTIATMLVTPVKRADIAIGKILSLGVIALLAGISSALGTILSLPKLMGAASDEISANAYGMNDYLMLGVVILSTVLLLITMISIVSAFAKSTKEAQTFVTPLMIIVMFLGITSMFGSGASENWYIYLIPLYNSVQCMTAIFSFDVTAVNVAIAAASNVLYAGIGVYALTRMFNSERIIFSR